MFSPSSAATLQTTARKRLDSLPPTLQHNPHLQFNLKLHNSQAQIAVPGNTAEACHCKSFLDTAKGVACEQTAQPVGEKEACKQVAVSKTAFTESPGAPQALLPAELEDKQLRQHNDFQLGGKPITLISPDCCQMTITALAPMQPGTPTDIISHLQSLSSSALAAPQPYDLSTVSASYAAEVTKHRQVQAGSAAVQNPAPSHQPEAALQQSVPACHSFSRPEASPSLLSDNLSTLDAQVLVSELSASASLNSSASMTATQHYSHVTDSPVATVKAVFDCSVGRLFHLSNHFVFDSIFWAAMFMYSGL